MRESRERSLALNLRLGAVALVCASLSLPARAALVTSTSERFSGYPAPEILGETIDSQILTRPAGAGKASCVYFFASWCPVCQAESRELRAIQATYSERGMEFVGVLVDSLETPDTLEDARRDLARAPLPFPVVLMDGNLRASFQYVGFPAIHFIAADGTFSTTLYGYHARETIAGIADRVLLGAAPTTGTISTRSPATAAPSAVPPPPGSPSSTEATAPAGPPGPAPWSHSPFLALVPSSRKQTHPLMVHFPVALLGLELIVVAVYLVRPRDSLDAFSGGLLWCAAVSFIPSIYTGISDVGGDLGPGLAFWNGLQDRIHHFSRLESSVSLHVLFALLTALFVLGRLAWRIHFGRSALAGRKRYVFAALSLVGFWALFAAGQVGGSISHP